MKPYGCVIARHLAEQLASVGKLHSYTEHEVSGSCSMELGDATRVIPSYEPNTVYIITTSAAYAVPVCAEIVSTAKVTYDESAEGYLQSLGIKIRTVDSQSRT